MIFKCLDLTENDATLYHSQIKKFEVEFTYTVEQIKHLIVYELELSKKGVGQNSDQSTPPHQKPNILDLKLDSN